MRRLLSVFAICLLASLAPAGEEEEELLTPDDIPTPIVDTEVGDWALYDMADGSSMRLTVTERWTEHGDDHLIIRSETTRGRGRKKRTTVLEEQVSVKERVADARDIGIFGFITRRTINVGGRRLDTVVVNYVEDGKVVRQSFFSGRVPVYGLVRGMLLEPNKQTVALNLEDFGRAGDEE